MSRKQVILPVLVVIEIGRITLPLLIFSHPVVALGASLIFDSLDGQLFYEAGFRWKIYNTVDKLLDYWWYCFILLFFIQTPDFSIAFVLFSYRSVGQILGIIKQNEKIYTWFPNLLEWYFLLYLLFPSLNQIISLIIIIPWSILVEWVYHLRKHRGRFLAKYFFKREINWKKNG